MNISWIICNGTETTGSGDTEKTCTGTYYGSCSFAPPTENFTPYDQLTEQQVLDWCFDNGVDQAAIEANVTQQINNQINPPVVVLPLPWVPPVIVVPPMLPQVTPVLVANDTPVSDASAA